MRLHFDRKADALYLRLDESPVQESEEVSPGVVLDFNAAKQVVAIPLENLVCLDMEHDVKVPRGPAAQPTFAVA